MSLERLAELLEEAETIVESLRAAQNPPTVAPGSPTAPVAHPPGLRDPAAFFAALRASKVLGGTLEQREVDGCSAILEACKGWPVSWAAYALATAVIETAGAMQPIKEYGGEGYFRKQYDIQGDRPAKARELGNLTPGDGAKYAGRGYVQLTGRVNYDRAERALGHPFTASPDLALVQQHAAAIMRQGMEGGWFTGRSLADYLPAVATREQFRAARKVINGQDRADEIAGFAMLFQAALQSGGWR
jgi:putative chitinase